MSQVPTSSPAGAGRPLSRRGLLRGSTVLGAGALALSVGAGGLASPMTAVAGPLDTDWEILNYALTLEHLEAAAYKAVLGTNVLTGRALTYFREFGAHEAAHVTTLVDTIRKLGGTPVAPARYNFTSVPRDAAGVVRFFQEVESVGASAYLGAAPSIKDPDLLEAALSIHAVEAEHAAALADIVAPGTSLFAPDAFPKPRTPDEVMAIVAPFFAAMPGMPRTGAGGGAMTNHGSGLLGLAGLGLAALAALAARQARPAAPTRGD